MGTLMLAKDGIHALVGIHLFHGLWSEPFMETKHGIFKTIIQPRKEMEETDFITILGAATHKGMAKLHYDGGID